jgi:hypothetical protein
MADCPVSLSSNLVRKECLCSCMCACKCMCARKICVCVRVCVRVTPTGPADNPLPTSLGSTEVIIFKLSQSWLTMFACISRSPFDLVMDPPQRSALSRSSLRTHRVNVSNASAPSSAAPSAYGCCSDRIPQNHGTPQNVSDSRRGSAPGGMDEEDEVEDGKAQGCHGKKTT